MNLQYITVSQNDMDTPSQVLSLPQKVGKPGVSDPWCILVDVTEQQSFSHT